MSEPVYRYLGARAALRRAMVGGVIAAAGLALVPAVVSPFQLLFAAEMLIQCLFALAFNLLWDGIRDALDPQTERIFAARRRRKKQLPIEGPALVEPPRPVTEEE